MSTPILPRLFDVHFSLLGKSLDFRAKRNSLLAGNLANVETPGYKAKDMVFEKALGKAMHSLEPGPLKVSHPNHNDGHFPLPVHQVSATVIETATPDASLDGNTVDLETEMAKLAENQLMFNGLVQMMGHKFRLLKMAIREGNPS